MRRGSVPRDELQGRHELLVVGPLFGVLVHAVHDEVAEGIGVPAGVDVLHHVDEELVLDLQGVQVVAPHSLLDGGGFDHAHPHHEHLLVGTQRKRIEELDLEEVQLLGGEQRHRFGVLQNHLVGSLALLQEEGISELDVSIFVHEDVADLDISVQRLHRVEIVQAADHVVEDPADLALSDGLAHLAAILDFVEETIRIEVIDYSIPLAVGSAEVVGLHLCDLYFNYLC